MPNKKYTFYLIIAAVFFSWLFNILLGRFFTAKISTWPALNRLHILSPQAPIVINNRETVRVEAVGNAGQIAGQTKSKISLLAIVSPGGLEIAGAAVNLTSDGSFVTGVGAFSKSAGNYFIILSDGSTGKVTDRVTDPATGLIFFKADINNVPVASLGVSKDVSVGERLVFAVNSLENYTVRISEGLVNFAQSDELGQPFLTDYPKRSFGVTATGSLQTGEALINSKGDVVGLWNGSSLISADVLSDALTRYFKNQKNIIRPSFGFSYTLIGQNEALLSGSHSGAVVKDITPNSPAAKAGLVIGDLITAVDGRMVDENSALEENLQKYSPSDTVKLSVLRKGQFVDVNLIVGELK